MYKCDYGVGVWDDSICYEWRSFLLKTFEIISWDWVLLV